MKRWRRGFKEDGGIGEKVEVRKSMASGDGWFARGIRKIYA
jgi:hypothetical protein